MKKLICRFKLLATCNSMLIIHCCLLVILILTSCSNNKTNSNLKIFRYNEFSSVNSLDPAFTIDQSTSWIVNQLFNGLVQYDEKLNLKPSIAKSWEISKDGLKYSFHLRNDVFFQSSKFKVQGLNKGRKVVANDFVYSFNRIVDKTVASPGSWVFNCVRKNKDSSYGFIVK